MPIALLSVSDKTELTEFAASLAELGWEFVASGGTAKALRGAGLTVTDISELTGAPEMLGGRVKTLHPTVHGGILARATPEDEAELNSHGISLIDLVVCNLYPFQQTIAKPDVRVAQAIEQIDIGGVTLLRAAAKNFARVTVVCDPDDYQAVAADIRENGGVPETRRAELARKAFNHTAAYDAAISSYLSAQSAETLPATLNISLVKTQEMRYGENPHQAAALYAVDGSIGPLGGTLLQGKALSYNNMLDSDAAWQAAQSFELPTVVIVKHLSPCGIASGPDLASAFPEALASDPVSAFGGIIAVNRAFDEATAKGLGDLFVEAIVAPVFTPEARQILAGRKNCRLLEIPEPVPLSLEMRAVAGGVLVQERDGGDPDDTEWRVVTARQPTEAEMETLKFAWQACQHVKSNSIVFAAGTATIGIGGGLPSRVDAVKLAAAKAGDKAQGAAMASDAFFPFPDGIEAAAQAGVRAVVQPGGSVRDDVVIEAADKLGLTMVFTGVRHFRH
ncbi:MAG: bifunctional phosphoribosylaminoimidazolecarboxamide formyltransferase/IMP cyclohydrolase [Anaerolineae bacterium]|nr:bifunctional phosphoribosylaminoimidazolecarboxamide formyltransferase/IMP cyclohydrolase [Anaerolineae bacterium]